MSTDSFEEGDRVYVAGDRGEVVRPHNGLNVKVQLESEDVTRLVNPAGVQRLEDVQVTAVDGVGDARAEKLAQVGVSTVGDLVDADDEDLQEAGLSGGQIENLVDSAEEFLGS